jgi:hypothetical protein
MAKMETINFSEFMRGDYKKPTVMQSTVKHVKEHKVVYTIAGYTVVCLVGAPHFGLAAGGGTVGAEKLYYQLCKVGKWIIIGKGGWETINSAVKSDYESAKKQFLSYLLIYVILLGLPYAMDKVDELFTGLSKS